MLVQGIFDYFTFYNLLQAPDKPVVVSTLGFYVTPEAATILNGLDIEHFMVRSFKRWGRIVDIAAQHEFTLPTQPDSKSLEEFLAARKAAYPLRFADLSLAVIKLLGSGEYVVEAPNEAVPGHFGLAVRGYTHSTAPSRRFPDLITQRILKGALDGSSLPYSLEELTELDHRLAVPWYRVRRLRQRGQM